MLTEPKSPTRRSQSTHSSDETGENRRSQGVQEGSCVMTKPKKRKHAKSQAAKPAKNRDYIPVTVPFGATPARETLGIDQWAHRAVWTDRMLETLLQDKVKGGKWHTLIDKVFWFNYFRHCHWNIFKDYDGLIRRRLRRLLLKRQRRNRKRLTRNQRWPNTYFTERGFVSLNERHIRFVQSTGTY